MEDKKNWKVDFDSENEVSERVTVASFAEKCQLKLISKVQRQVMEFKTVNINRPGLLLAGFNDYFAEERIQVMGNAETYFLSKRSFGENQKILENLMSRRIPCIIFARGIEPTAQFMSVAQVYDIPVFISQKPTTQLINSITSYLNKLLCEATGLHGVLMEISGVGVLLTGHSGLGKSETALELIHRGHRLVADDAVQIKKVNNKLIGTAPERIRFFMEVRGIGIIDVRSMFGVGSVLFDKEIDLVIELEKWQEAKEYERIDIDTQTTTILGLGLPMLTMPVMPGRNLAIVVEVAARNHRLKAMGFNAKDELLKNQNFK